MAGLRDKTAIAGIGWTKYSRASGVSVLSLAAEACKNAAADAGVPLKEIDGIVTFNMGDSVSTYSVGECLGIPELRYVVDIWGGSPIADAVVGMAATAVMAGLADNVLVFRALNGRSGRRLGGSGERASTAGVAQFLVPFGYTSFIHSCAFWQTRHMALYGTTERQLGAVAVTERQYAVLNDRAMMRKPITIDDYLNSRWITWPVRLLDVCLETDGACALLVTSAERARGLRQKPVYIMAAAWGGGATTNRLDMNVVEPGRWTDHAEQYGKYLAPRLYQQAGITAADVDIAELYDELTINVILQVEDFGFCKKGEGGAFVESGNTGPLGRLPTNTHGGLLSEAYMHGLNHVVEAVSQLRGQAGPRQIKDAEIALTTGMGVSNGSALILRR